MSFFLLNQIQIYLPFHLALADGDAFCSGVDDDIASSSMRKTLARNMSSNNVIETVLLLFHQIENLAIKLYSAFSYDNDISGSNFKDYIPSSRSESDNQFIDFSYLVCCTWSLIIILFDTLN